MRRAEFSGQRTIHRRGCCGFSARDHLAGDAKPAQTQRAHRRMGNVSGLSGTSGYRSPLQGQRLARSDQVRRAPRLALGASRAGALATMPNASPVRHRQRSARSAGDATGVAQPVIVACVVSWYTSAGRAGFRVQHIAEERAVVQTTPAQGTYISAQVIGHAVRYHDPPVIQARIVRAAAAVFVRLDLSPLKQHSLMPRQRG